MKTIEIRVERFDFEDVASHLMQLSKDEGVSIQVTPPPVGSSGLALDTPTIIASGANVLAVVITSLFLYLGTVGTGEIVIKGKGWSVEAPWNMPKKDIEHWIEHAQGLHQTKDGEEPIVIWIVNLEGGF
jgi:hypothetical protein